MTDRRHPLGLYRAWTTRTIRLFKEIVEVNKMTPVPDPPSGPQMDREGRILYTCEKCQEQAAAWPGTLPTVFDDALFTARCPECEKAFTLNAEHIKVHACESGGVYAIWIHCPRCRYKVDVL